MVKSACVICVDSVTGGPKIFGGTFSCLSADDTGREGALYGAVEGREQEIATAATNNPIAKSVVSFVFICAFFSSHSAKYKCRFGVDLVTLGEREVTASHYYQSRSASSRLLQRQ